MICCKTSALVTLDRLRNAIVGNEHNEGYTNGKMINKYWLSDLTFGNGPTQSIIRRRPRKFRCDNVSCVHEGIKTSDATLESEVVGSRSLLDDSEGHSVNQRDRTGASERTFIDLPPFCMNYLCNLYEIAGRNPTSLQRVAPSLPPDVATCLLQQTTMVASSSVLCGSICFNNPNCTLFCVLDNVCSLFSALVSNLWPGSSAVNALHFNKCFSILPPANNIPSYSSVTSSGLNPLNAIKGYSCSNQSCFLVTSGYQNVWQLEFPQSLTYTRVIIKQDPSILFHVEVRVGNNSNSSNNNRYGYIFPPPNGLIIIDLPNTAIGRFFTLVGEYYTLNLCYVQIYIQ
nr:uncharacterized protein LOC128703731 [Cherax quadricarinatus]